MNLADKLTDKQREQVLARLHSHGEPAAVKLERSFARQNAEEERRRRAAASKNQLALPFDQASKVTP